MTPTGPLHNCHLSITWLPLTVKGVGLLMVFQVVSPTLCR